MKRLVLILVLGCTKRVDTAATVVAETQGVATEEAMTTTTVDDQPDRVTTVVEEYSGELIPGASTVEPPRLARRTTRVEEHGAVETVTRTETASEATSSAKTTGQTTAHTDSAPTSLLSFLFGKLWLVLLVAGVAAVGLWKRTWLAAAIAKARSLV